jgi:hypothetical protein
MHKIELSETERKLLLTMITREIEETRLELHHTKNAEYKQDLREYESALKNILDRIRKD